jgi:D-galactarolactone cycloisomerase
MSIRIGYSLATAIARGNASVRIAEIRTFLLDAPLTRPFAYARGWVEKRSALLVEVITDTGLNGWGEAFGPPRLSRAAIEHLMPVLAGADALATEAIWQRIAHENREHGRKGPVMDAASALDIALWDIKGKHFGVPIYRLMGGPIRRQVPAYASGLFKYRDVDYLDGLSAEARLHVRNGFGAVKMKVGFGVDEDAAAVAAVRQAIGPKIDLLIDANEAYDAPAAIRLGRKIEHLDIGWFEEPVPPDDIDGYRAVKAALAMPIAGGEAEFGLAGFKELFLARAVDIAQPDICGAGGFTQCKKIADAAHAFGVRFCPHSWGTPINLAASLQLLAVIPDSMIGANPVPPYLEMDCTEHPIRDALMPAALRPVDGIVRIPDGPGLGIEIDRAAVERFQVS